MAQVQRLRTCSDQAWNTDLDDPEAAPDVREASGVAVSASAMPQLPTRSNPKTRTIRALGDSFGVPLVCFFAFDEVKA